MISIWCFQSNFNNNWLTAFVSFDFKKKSIFGLKKNLKKQIDEKVVLYLIDNHPW